MEPDGMPIASFCDVGQEEAMQLQDLKRRLLGVICSLTGDNPKEAANLSETNPPMPSGLIRRMQTSMDNRRKSIGEMQNMLSHLESLINGTQAANNFR